MLFACLERDTAGCKRKLTAGFTLVCRRTACRIAQEVLRLCWLSAWPLEGLIDQTKVNPSTAANVDEKIPECFFTVENVCVSSTGSWQGTFIASSGPWQLWDKTRYDGWFAIQTLHLSVHPMYTFKLVFTAPGQSVVVCPPNGQCPSTARLRGSFFRTFG